jgi:hypothetical protein
MKKLPPIMPAMCGTCPFREGSPHANLAELLTLSALTESSRICHSTGSNAIHHRTGKKPKICRGARDKQLAMFAAMGFISEPTDAAWAAKWAEIQKEKRSRRAI